MSRFNDKSEDGLDEAGWAREMERPIQTRNEGFAPYMYRRPGAYTESVSVAAVTLNALGEWRSLMGQDFDAEDVCATREAAWTRAEALWPQQVRAQECFDAAEEAGELDPFSLRNHGRLL